MASPGGKNQVHSKATPGSTNTPDRESPGRQNRRPVTGKKRSTSSPDRKQELNSKEEMKKLENYCKGQTEKHAHVLHQPHNTVDLQDVGKDLLERELEENKAELEMYKRKNENLTQENNQLRSENKSLNKEIQRLRAFEESNGEVNKYEEKTEHLTNENTQLLGTIKSLKEEKERLNEERERLIEEKKILAEDKQSLIEEAKRHTELKQSFLNIEHEQCTKELENEQERAHLLEKIDRLTVEKEILLKREREHSTKEWENLRKDLIKSHEKERAQLIENIDRLNVEKDKLLKRLSTVAADRLTHENPKIVDLSDENRPTKLQEVYGELYDNEWTDAFEELKTHMNISDKDAILILLKIIMNSFRNCREITWGRYEKLVNVASSIYLEKKTPVLCTEKEGAANGETVCKLKTSAHDTKKPAEANMTATSTASVNSCNEMDGPENNKTSVDQRNRDEKMKSTTTKVDMTSAKNVQSTKDEKCEEKDIEERIGNIDKSLPDKEECSSDNTVANENLKTTKTNKDMAPTEKLGASTEQKDIENKEISEDPKKGEENIKTSEDPKAKCSIELNVKILHAIKDIWKTTCFELKGISAESIYSVVATNLDMPLESMPDTSKYLKSCIDLCWRMGVQERPLHLEAIDEIDVKAGKKFDKDKFRHYTKSGEKVEYVVWPALYLYEGGSLVLKGIAQGC